MVLIAQATVFRDMRIYQGLSQRNPDLDIDNFASFCKEVKYGLLMKASSLKGLAFINKPYFKSFMAQTGRSLRLFLVFATINLQVHCAYFIQSTSSVSEHQQLNL